MAEGEGGEELSLDSLKKEQEKLVLFVAGEIESLNRLKAGKSEAASLVESLQAQLQEQEAGTLAETTAMTEQFDQVEADLLAQLAEQNATIIAMREELGAFLLMGLARGVGVASFFLRHDVRAHTSLLALRSSPPRRRSLSPLISSPLTTRFFRCLFVADAERAHLQAQTDDSSERMGEREAQIEALQRKLNQLTDLFARMLQEVLDKLKERIEVANPTWQNRNIATISTKLASMDAGPEAEDDEDVVGAVVR